MNTLQIDTQLKNGEYKITRILGQGGFGITYQAEQTALGRTVAVKEFFMKDSCNRNAGTRQVSVPSTGSKDLVGKFKDKFLREARMIASLNHPNIVKIFDVFEENGTAYYVMEFIGGGSLAEKVKSGGAMPEPVALGYIRQVADALSYLHKQKILHFDVKPSNVLLDEANRTKLIDFGISKHYDEAGGQTSSTPVGISQGYAPLEQYQAKDVQSFTPATDIYALGATLYTLLTGKNPPDASAILLSGVPSMSSNVSASVKSAIGKAMEPKLTDRPQNIEAFLSCLEAPVKNEEINDETPEDETTRINAPSPAPPAQEPSVTPEKSEESEKSESLKLFLKILLILIILAIPGAIVKYKTKQIVPIVAEWHEKAKEDSLKAWAEETARRIEEQTRQRKASEVVQNTQNSTTTNRSNRISVTVPVTVPGIQVEFDMVLVEAGNFTMGATAEQGNDYQSDETMRHVTLTKDYYIGEYEVTQELYEAVMGNNPSYFKGARLPVENVSWDDAQTFCSRLSGITRPIRIFRLPTEAEWEYAARGGHLKPQQTKYAGSNDSDAVAWHGGNSANTSHPVGMKSPNALGLYDMSGNLYEWCQDWYGDYGSGAQTNPTGPSMGSYRVYRGGSWGSDAQYCRVSSRHGDAPSNRGINVGFRLVCEPFQDFLYNDQVYNIPDNLNSEFWNDHPDAKAKYEAPDGSTMYLDRDEVAARQDELLGLELSLKRVAEYTRTDLTKISVTRNLPKPTATTEKKSGTLYGTNYTIEKLRMAVENNKKHEESQNAAKQNITTATAASDRSDRLAITVPGTQVQFSMVLVEAGNFTMGATTEQGDDSDSDEEPSHRVTLTRDYYMGEYEVTQALYKAVMGDNPSHFKGANLPVETVSWDEAQTFCTRLSNITGRTFRLPTEAEWEYAARGGHLASRQTKYAGRNRIGTVAWYQGNSNHETHPAGTKSPNALGLHDMSGNVSEWCQDWYQDWYGDGSGEAQTNPAGPSMGSERVYRGGSWGSGAQDCRVSNRHSGAPSDRHIDIPSTNLNLNGQIVTSSNRFTVTKAIRNEFIGFRLVCDTQ